MPGFLMLVVGALGGAGLMHWIDRQRLRTGENGNNAPGVLSFGEDDVLTPQQKKDALLVSLLEEDLRSQFTHPAAIRVSAHDGVVTLSGPVMADEHERLLAHVRRFRGVRGVEDALKPQQQRGDLPDVHTGSHVHDDEGI